MTLLVGITGGIGSGKSTFSKEVVKRKLEILDSDKQVSLIYQQPKKDFLTYLKKIGLSKAIKKRKVNKKYITEEVFSNKVTKSNLEKYIFKIIRKNRKDFINKQKKLQTKIAFFDIPLLFENNLDNNFDIIISIISTKKNRFKRLRTKKISKKIFNNILKSQTTDIIRKKRSDIIIYNNNSLKNYVKKINNTLDKIVK